ncbi:MAG: DUF1127 domain-containing protein [Rhodobacteraceae bacterium]|nr:DUF1127 domain-containing protein [Paracoccaceae bacterium]
MSVLQGSAATLPDQFGRFLDTPIKRLSDWRRRRAIYNRTYRELAALTDRDLADISISRADIAAIARKAADDVMKRR